MTVFIALRHDLNTEDDGESTEITEVCATRKRADHAVKEAKAEIMRLDGELDWADYQDTIYFNIVEREVVS